MTVPLDDKSKLVDALLKLVTGSPSALAGDLGRAQNDLSRKASWTLTLLAKQRDPPLPAPKLGSPFRDELVDRVANARDPKIQAAATEVLSTVDLLNGDSPDVKNSVQALFDVGMGAAGALAPDDPHRLDAIYVLKKISTTNGMAAGAINEKMGQLNQKPPSTRTNDESLFLSKFDAM